MASYLTVGSPTHEIDDAALEAHLTQVLDQLGALKLKRILLLPPDITRFYSAAGKICALLYARLSTKAHVDLLPAIGTHVPMSEAEIRRMFGPDIPLDRFLVHDWRSGLTRLGEVPASEIREWSEGAVDFSMGVEIDHQLIDGGYDLILSVGQIVPHEVVGMANYTKNLCIGVGGRDTINKSHYLGAVYGMERIMGHADTPVRQALNYGYDHFMQELPIVFLLTVMQKNLATGKMCMRGLYAGDDYETFKQGCALSQQVNLDLLDAPLRKVVVYLEPEEFKSTWLGNKAIYRTRMAIADDGELIVLAPALKEFGEDAEIDRLIRKYGYRGTGTTIQAVQENEELQGNLSAAAHLIHGSSEGRFSVTYCPGPGMTLDDVRSVGYKAVTYDEMIRRYDPEKLVDGVNILPDGEEIFYISNPGLGLWAWKERFVKGS